MSKERYEREHEWVIDNDKRKTKEESIIVYDEAWNTLDDLCGLLNGQDKTISDLEAKLAEKDKEIARLKLLVDGFDKLKQYDKDADLILINPKNCYADGKELVIKSTTKSSKLTHQHEDKGE